MIELSVINDKCFAELPRACSALSVTEPHCDYRCAFYKPAGCEDWIRRETESGSYLIPPEEYEEYRK